MLTKIAGTTAMFWQDEPREYESRGKMSSFSTSTAATPGGDGAMSPFRSQEPP
jgi:hypothetical protein